MNKEHCHVLGLTGPTGAGKSTVSAFLQRQGFLIIDADKLAREVTNAESACLRGLVGHFGADILYPDGTLDRRALAQKAFASPQETDKLNALTHPYITQRIKECIEVAEKEGRSWAVLDAPTLLESGADRLCDRILVVTADPDVRCARIRIRDHLTEKEARLRMRAQHDDAFYAARADYILKNNGSTDTLIKKLSAILKELRAQDGENQAQK